VLFAPTSPAEIAATRVPVTAMRTEPPVTVPAPRAGEPAQSFALWFAARLRREGLTMEAAARRLEVSTKTVSRWVAGATEPRLRDVYRIRETFGEPFH
jgi:DNA-binding XRE family transcriptional regulator